MRSEKPPDTRITYDAVFAFFDTLRICFCCHAHWDLRGAQAQSGFRVIADRAFAAVSESLLTVLSPAFEHITFLLRLSLLRNITSDRGTNGCQRRGHENTVAGGGAHPSSFRIP